MLQDPAPSPELLAVTLELMEAAEEVRFAEVRLELARQYLYAVQTREQEVRAKLFKSAPH
jgi:hypothetical protein